MSIARINIEQQYATIGIHVTPAQLNIKSNRPQMVIEQQTPEMTIEKQNPRFKVNWKKVHAEMGIPQPHDFTLSIRDNSKNEVMNYIGESVRDGEFLGKTEQPGNRIAQLARKKSNETANVGDLNIASMPKSLPDITWDPGYMRIKWTDHQFNVSWEGEYMPDLIVDPKYAIEIFLRDKPYIHIWVDEESLLPNQPGYLVDEVR